MRLLWFYISHTFINAIKKLFRTWVAIIIGVCVFIGIIAGFAGELASKTLPSDGASQGSYTEEQAELEQAEPEKNDFEMSEELLHIVLETGVGIVALAMMLGFFYFADKNGTAIFTMPDVNFLFPAPLKPQSVLMFRTILKMGLALVGSIYLFFQLPNLVLNLGLGLLAAVMLIVAWVVILVLCQLISVFTYTVTATHEKLRKYIRPSAIAVIIAVVGTVAGQVYIGKIPLLKAVANIFASKVGRAVPVWGWFRGFVMSMIEGSWLAALGYFVLLALSVAIAIFFIWRLRADFYEDALASAIRNQEFLEKKTESKATLGQNRKRKNAEKKAGEFGRGQGAQMFLVKGIYNRRRFAKGGFLTNTALLYFLICGTFVVIQRFLLPSNNITVMSAVVLGFLFFRNFGNPIAEEAILPYLFTIPEKPAEKLYYCLLAGLYDTICDVAPAYLLAVLFMNGSVTAAAFWILLFISFDLINSVSGLLLELALPSHLHRMIRASLQLMLKALPLLPNILILTAVGASWNLLPAMAIAFVFNLALAAVLFALCPALLHRGRN